MPSPCKAGKAQVAYFYGSSLVGGGLCLTNTQGNYVRSILSQTLVPPPAPTITTFINPSGQTTKGLVSVRVPQGGTNVSLGGVDDPVSTLEWIDVSRTGHSCRHLANAADCE